MRLFLAILVGKITVFLCRITKQGGGTTLPGLVAGKIDPYLVEKLSSRIDKGNIVISGTNGKTTTAKMIATIFKEVKISSIHNRAGSNLIRGVASTLLSESTLLGKLNKDIGIFEIDEATLPLAIQKLKPRLIVITNFFRDQLDRYGELDIIAGIAKKALKNLPPKARLILNANDPFVAFLNKDIKNDVLPGTSVRGARLFSPRRMSGLKNKVIFYGIEDEKYSLKKAEHAADIKNCPRCGSPYKYQALFFSHIGKFYCQKCNISYPPPSVYASKIDLSGAKKAKIKINLPGSKLQVNINLPGIYNVYNALAAASGAYALGVNTKAIKQGLKNFSAVFGRVEEIEIDNKKLVMFLVKNPTGFNQVIKTLSRDPGAKNFIMALNDKLADGTDVSWIWDVDFEMFKDKKINFVYVSGIRATDMALRLKYALFNKEKIFIEQDYNILIRKALAQTKKGKKIYLLPTYTAMLDIRKALQKLTKLSHFWEDV